jgi:hypothetical protein
MLQGVVRVFDGYLSGVAEVSSAVETWAVVGAADWFVVQVTALRIAGTAPKVQVGAVSSVDGAQFKSPDFVDVDLANTALAETILGEPLDDSPRGAYTKFVLRMHQPDGVALVRLDVGLRRRERLPLGTPIGGDLGTGCGCRSERPDGARSGRAALPGGLPPGAQLIDGPTPRMDPVSPPAFPPSLLPSFPATGARGVTQRVDFDRLTQRCNPTPTFQTRYAPCVDCTGVCVGVEWGLGAITGTYDYACVSADELAAGPGALDRRMKELCAGRGAYFRNPSENVTGIAGCYPMSQATERDIYRREARCEVVPLLPERVRLRR